jgi:probable selenium-dependent hydroxylase accessory protein YqeC
MLIEALGLERARLVALCGAGGKTSLMFALACEMAAAGERVLVTTTTKIGSSEAESALPPGVSISHGGKSADGRKLTGHPPEYLDQLKQAGSFDRLLVEADGSRRKPLKAPAAHEPVIPATTDAVVVVAGLSGLGRPLSEETVFRAEIWATLSGIALGAPVSAESLARVALHEAGLAKGCPASARVTLFLNQAHTPESYVAAATIGRMISAAATRPYERVVYGCLLPSPHVTRLTAA